MKYLSAQNIVSKQMFEGGRVKLIHSDRMTFAEWEFEANTNLPEHSHPHEQITRVIKGEFEITVEGKTILMKPGDTIIIAPNEVHSAKSITESVVLDIFNPVREDLRY